MKPTTTPSSDLPAPASEEPEEPAPYEAPALGAPVSLANATLFSGAVTDAGVVFGGG